MINTVQAGDHRLWDQIVRKEQEAKKRFEFLTGETVARKFYNGSNLDNVDKNLQTYKGKFDIAAPTGRRGEVAWADKQA